MELLWTGVFLPGFSAHLRDLRVLLCRIFFVICSGEHGVAPHRLHDVLTRLPPGPIVRSKTLSQKLEKPEDVVELSEQLRLSTRIA